eukprot:691527-Rhodomonas_salina.3
MAPPAFLCAQQGVSVTRENACAGPPSCCGSGQTCNNGRCCRFLPRRARHDRHVDHHRCNPLPIQEGIGDLDAFALGILCPPPPDGEDDSEASQGEGEAEETAGLLAEEDPNAERSSTRMQQINGQAVHSGRRG